MAVMARGKRRGLILVLALVLLGAVPAFADMGYDDFEVHRDPSPVPATVSEYPLDDITRLEPTTATTLIVFDKLPAATPDHRHMPAYDESYDVPYTLPYEEVTTSDEETPNVLQNLSEEMDRVYHESTVRPGDNFNEHYQALNDTLFHANDTETEDRVNPYPPMPTLATEQPPRQLQPQESYEDLTDNAAFDEPHVNGIPNAVDVDVTLGVRDPEETDYEGHNTPSVAVDAVSGTVMNGNARQWSQELSGYDVDGGTTDVFTKSGPAFGLSQTYLIRSTMPPLTSKKVAKQHFRDPEVVDDPYNSLSADASADELSEDTTPFAVTTGLLNSMGVTPAPTTQFGPEHPTLLPATTQQAEDEETVVTSDYMSNLDPDQRTFLFPRDHLQPWERHRGEKSQPGAPLVSVRGKIKKVMSYAYQEDENTSQNLIQPMRPIRTYRGSSYPVEATTPYYTQTLLPNVPYMAMPDGGLVIPALPGTQTPIPQYAKIRHLGHKIDRENTVNVKHTVLGDSHKYSGSDLFNSPQFAYFGGHKVTKHKAFGRTVHKPTVQTFDFYANPITLFDIAMPQVLKTAVALGAKVYEENKLHAARSNARVRGKADVEPDPSGNPLKFRKKTKPPPTPAPVTILDDLGTIVAGGSSEDSQLKSFFEDDYSDDQSQACGSFVEFRSQSTVEFLSRCVQVADNCMLADASPMERRMNLNLSDCVRFCAQNPTCKSITYSQFMSLCDIYPIQNGTTDSNLVAYDGILYLQPTPGFSSLASCIANGRTDKPKLKGIETHVFRPGSTAPTEVPPAEEREDIIVTSDYWDDEPPTRQPHTTVSDDGEVTRRPAPVDPRGMRCPPQDGILMIKTAEYQLEMPPGDHVDTVRQQSSQDECVLSCIMDLLEGSAPFPCSSAVYEPRTRSCVLMGEPLGFHANNHLLDAPGMVMYEKACVTANFVEQCQAGAIERVPQKTLLGYAVIAKSAENLVACITACYDRFHESHDCLSVSYFYAEIEHNCVLSSESHRTAPLYFVDEVEVTVDFVAIDQCVLPPEENQSTSNRRFHPFDDARVPPAEDDLDEFYVDVDRDGVPLSAPLPRPLRRKNGLRRSIKSIKRLSSSS